MMQQERKRQSDTIMVPVPSHSIVPDRDVDRRPVLETRHLGIEFGGLKAVEDFNLTIGATEIAGLIGPNGAGKTTVFNLLTKVYQPTSGVVILDGKDTAGMNAVQANKLGIARTFQNIRLFGNMTVEENVRIGLHNQVKYGMFSGIFRMPAYWKQEKKQHERRWICCPSLICRIWPTYRQIPCPTARSAAWRSSALLPPIPSCCCWTNLPQA